MTTPLVRKAQILSGIILFLGIIASAGGLLINGLYRDSGFIKTAWYANDVITLFVVLPALIYSMQAAGRANQIAHLVWMGLIGYMLYNYAFYLFGAAFNEFFLLYAVIFSLSIYTLILGLAQLDANTFKEKFSEKIPARSIAIFLIFISIPLAIVEGVMCVNFILTGKVPEAPSLIFALDLSIVVPNTALAAVLLWRRHAWGYVLAVMMLVKGSTYGLVLSTSATMIVLRGVGAWDFLMPFYVFVTLGSLTALYAMFRKTSFSAKEAMAS